MSTDFRELVNELAEMGSHYIGDLHDIVLSLSNENVSSFPIEVRALSFQMYNAIHLTSESILILVMNNKEWDADILDRTIIEGTLKFLYLLSGNKNEQLAKRKEYQDDIPKILSLKDNDKLKTLFEEVDDPSAEKWKPLRDMLLSEDVEEEIKNNYPRSVRQKVTWDWSFTGLMKNLTSYDDKYSKSFNVLYHPYSMKCHLSHLDGIGLGIIRDRILRSEMRRDAVSNSHAVRLVSDVCSLAMIRTAKLIESHGKVTRSLVDDMNKKYEKISQIQGILDKHFRDVEY